MSKKKISNVLLIDDDTITNFVNKKIIHNYGFTGNIEIAFNVNEALECLNKLETNLNDHIDNILI